MVKCRVESVLRVLILVKSGCFTDCEKLLLVYAVVGINQAFLTKKVNSQYALLQ